MSTFEIFLLIFSLIAIVWGAFTGIIAQLGSIAGIVVGVLACRIFGHDASDWLASLAQSGSSRAILTVLAYILVFVLGYIAAWGLFRILKIAAKKMQIGILDRLCGAVFKLFLFIFCLSLALNLWGALAPEMTPKGVWAQRVERMAPRILGSAAVTSIFSDKS
ncbi:MAG: CvpA family protein [Clostridium sp.]|nr:CvpA family protein [Clostridium sp.]